VRACVLDDGAIKKFFWTNQTNNERGGKREIKHYPVGVPVALLERHTTSCRRCRVCQGTHTHTHVYNRKSEGSLNNNSFLSRNYGVERSTLDAERKYKKVARKKGNIKAENSIDAVGEIANKKKTKRI
jgi:hypothetical protein